MLPTYAATIYDRSIPLPPFFLSLRIPGSPYNGELGRKLWPLGPASLSLPRLSIQHRPTYAFVRCIFMRLIIFFLFPSSLFVLLRLDYGFTAVTRLPRSLSPVQGMRNKSGPFSARLPSAIVFFPPLPIVKYRSRFFLAKKVW